MVRLLLCGCALGILVGCDSADTVDITIVPEQRVRQVSAVDYSSLVASVSFNAGAAQDVVFTDSAPRTVGFNNIIQGASNSYNITWLEVIDGVRLPIASQSGEFLAGAGGSTLDAAYNFGFDSNGNNVTNLSEREAGSCPWVACDELGALVDPEEVTQVLSNSVNFLLTKTGPREFTETVDTSGPHDWLLTSFSRTSILLNDASRNFAMEVDFSTGFVRIQETPEAEFRNLYTIDGVQ